jgi:hypothetical protein
MRPPTEERLVITGCASCGQAWKVGAAFLSCRLIRDKPCATIHRRAGWDKNPAIEKAGMNCGDNIYQDDAGIYDLLGILNKLLIAGRRRSGRFAPSRPSAAWR